MRGSLLLGLSILVITPFTTGCAGMSKTAQGAGIGGGVGAATGALIGKATNGKAGKGALIGGAVGAIAGGLIGNEEDKIDRDKKDAQLRDAEARAANVRTASMVTVRDVIQMTQERQKDDIIINQIRTTNATFQLTTDDLTQLNSNGVSERVILEMQNRRPDSAPRYIAAPQRPPRVIYTQAPPPPIYVVETYVPPPPPPPPIGFGVGVHIR